MTQPDEPGPCTDETGERVASQAETLASRAAIVRAVRVGSYSPAEAVRLPTAAELTDNATYAAMLDVMRQAEALRREAWARPCCAVCGQAVATPSVADGHAYHPACASCALERAFGDR